MKIDVIIPSRGHPLRLMSVITCFDALTSGNHDVTFRIVCDMDDPLTWKACGKLPGMKTAVHVGSGPLAKRMNEAARESEANVITTAADDVFPLAQNWDEIVSMGVEQGHAAFSWQEVRDPTNQTMIVFSHKWLSATGRMLPEYFPFWFGDTWIAEVYEMAFQRPMPIVENLPWGGKRGRTRNMRDLEFWFRFFASTRVERKAEARAICFAFGLPFVDSETLNAEMKRRDDFQLGRVPQYEEWFGANQGEPTQQYNDMKRIAEEWHG